MAVSGFYELYDVRGGGGEGGGSSIGAPNIHMIFGLSRTVHVHGMRGHVRCNSHSNTVLSWGLMC